MAFGQTPVSTTSLSANQFPVSAVAVPGEAGGNLTALEGGPETTDTNGNKTAPASMYIKDGNDVTQGTSTDANTVNSIMGRLTKIRDLLNATLTVGGTITEANSAAIKADLDAINTAIGAVSDAAWSGSGNGSEIAILKKIVAELAATLTVSGTVTANAGSGTFTNQQSNVTSDYDTGAGTQNLTMFGVALPASGGAVSGGTSTNPIRTDPTGATTQPVSGTVTANAGTGSFTVAQTTGSNLHTVLDAGSAVIGHVIADSGSTTAVTQATASNLNAQVQGAAASGASNTGSPVKEGGVFNTTQPTVTTGQVVDAQMTARGAQIVATGVDAFAVNASQAGAWNVTNVSGTVSLPTGAATAAKQPALGTAGSASSDVLTVQGIASMTAIKTDGSAVTQPVSGTVTANAGSGTFNTSQQASGAASATLQNAQTGNANGTSLNVLGMATVSFTVTASGFTGTVNFEGTEDNSNWSALLCTLAGGTTTATTASGAGQYSASCAGLQSVRARTSGVSAGNVTVTAHAVPVAGSGGGGGGSGSNASVSATTSAVPGSATYMGGNKGGNLVGVSLDGSGNLNVNVAAGGGSGGTSSSFGSALPATGTAIGFTDGTNMQAGKVFDADTGAGTEYIQGIQLRQGASGGSVEAGTSSHPLRTDPTGTTTQPVSAASLPLPTGAATAAKQPALGTAGSASSDVITVQGIASMTALKVDGAGVTQPVSGTVSITANSAVNVAQVAGTTTDTNSGNKSAGTQRVVLATDQPQLTNALKVDGSGSTQPVSGTVTANAGSGTFTNQQSNITTDYDTGAGTQTMTMFGLALPASGGSVAGGTSSNPVQVSLANTAANSTAVKVDGSAVTQPVSGTVTANAGTGSFTVAQATGSNLHTVLDAGSAVIGHVIADSGSTTAVTQATASNLNAQVQGAAASGASNAGNPVKDGGVFNTTQPTVTTGQVVDAQYTARGAQIVATGIDALNVSNVSGTVSLPTGAATSAKQPALGTAGSASSDVITVQGITSMTPLKTDGSGVTQPVSGTVTANAGTGIFNDASVGSTGASVPASASYVAGNKGGNLAGISLDGSGNLNVNVAAGGGSGGTSSTFNSTFPSTGTAVGASDGTNMKSLQVDGSGFLKVNVSAGGGSGGTSSSFGSALPATGTASGFTDGTNMQAGKVFDADTGAGTEYLQGVILRKSASGGSVEAATTSNPLRTDPTGTTTQPVSGTVSITANSAVNVAQVAGTTTDTNSGNKSPGTQRVVLATDQPALTNAQPANITQVSGAAIATGNTALPILSSAATGYVSAFGSNAAALTSSTDYAFKWGAGGTTQVNHIMVQNSTTSNLNFDLDVAANAGSPVLAPGQMVFLDVQTTALHLFQAGTPNVNGSSAGNIVVRGWL